jgi:hypothetical protein
MVVRQPDHGLQTGDFALHWGNVHTPLYEPREPMIAAATHHDDGWAEWETTPSLDPETGQPYQFVKLSPIEHVPLYRRGIGMAVQRHPYTGLAVSMHGAGLYNGRYGTFTLREPNFNAAEQQISTEFLEEQSALQQSLAESALGRIADGHPSEDEQVWYTYKLLQVWDRLSLQFAYRQAADGAIGPLPLPSSDDLVLRCTNAGDMTLRLDPYPFDESGRVFPLRASLIPDKRYHNATELVEALDRAPVTMIECRAVAA